MRTASCKVRLTSLGSAFPAAPFRCTVHSVYASALNLAVAGSGDLAALLTRPELSHPLSATVGDGYVAEGCNAAPPLDALGLSRGMPAWTESAALVFANGARFDLSGARRRSADAEVAPRAVAADPERLRRRGQSLAERQQVAATLLRWTLFSGEAADTTTKKTLQSALLGRFAAAAPGIRAALAADRPGDAAAQALRIVGLGPGLTPAGDDFLCGLALAAWTRTERPADLSAAVVGAWLDRLLAAIDGGSVPLTGDVSRSFLRQARAGRFSRALVDLARSFTPEATPRGEADYEAALDVLGRLGHSSGYDAATGFLFGLEGVGIHG